MRGKATGFNAQARFCESEPIKSAVSRYLWDMDELRFGTDGWRDRIGERFTTDNVRRAAQATADYLKAQGGQSVVVARDTRFGD